MALVLIWLVSVHSVLERREDVISDSGKALERTNAVLAEQTQQLLKVIEVFLDASDHYFMHNPDADPRFDQGYVDLIASFRARTHGKIDIRVIASDGGVFFPPARSATPVDNATTRDFFAATNGSHEQNMFVGTPFLGTVLNRWVLPVSFPLHARPHGIAVILAVIPLSVLENTFEATRQPSETIALLRAEAKGATILLRLPDWPGVIGRAASDDVVSHLMAQDKRSLAVDKPTPIDGKRRLMTYGRVADFPLLVLAGTDMVEVLRPWRNHRLIVLSLAALISAVALLISWRALRQLLAASTSRSRLVAEAGTDPMTGVANLRSFMQRLEEEIVRARRYRRPISLMMLDLDHFKEVNDRYGHHAGDQVLKSVAATSQSMLRTTDLLARYGGDEFIALMPETDAKEALAVITRLQSAIGELAIRHGAETLNVKVSIGLASLAVNDVTSQQLIDRADQALYAAKTKGRDRVIFLDDVRSRQNEDTRSNA